MNLWLMDGSVVDFKDTKKVYKDFEGFLIEDIPMYEHITPSINISAEAEWVIIADDHFTGDETLDTNVKLGALLEGKDFASFTSQQEMWAPASCNNNVVTMIDEARIPLSYLKEGKICADIEVKYLTQNGDWIFFNTSSYDMKGYPFLEVIKSVVKLSDKPVNAINLSALGENSAFVNDSTIKRRAIIKSIFWIFLGIRKFKYRILKNISEYILRNDLCTASNIKLKYHFGGDKVNTAELKITPETMSDIMKDD